MLLVTVMVRITSVPASAATGVYVGVNVVAPAVIDPAPFSVHRIVPFEAEAPLTVADPDEHITWLPPVVAAGNGFTVIVAEVEYADGQTPLDRTAR